jgi:hypothetical protein
MRSLTAIMGGREMLPYQGDRKLEELLESLFDDTISEGIVIWSEPGKKIVFTNCCMYSYTNYGG